MNVSVESSPNLYQNSNTANTINSNDISYIKTPKRKPTTKSYTSIAPNTIKPVLSIDKPNTIPSSDNTSSEAMNSLVPNDTTKSQNYASSSCSSSSISSSDDDITRTNIITSRNVPRVISNTINTSIPKSTSTTITETVQNKSLKRRILPLNFKDCPREDLLILISRMLTHIISLNDELDVKISSQELTRFHSRAPPNISIYSYLSRLLHYSSLDNAVLITAVYYIDLLSMTYPIFSINSLTVHRFLLTATTVGSKGLCDSFCSNNHYAKVGGVHISELNVLELEFLTNVNWRIIPRDFTNSINTTQGNISQSSISQGNITQGNMTSTTPLRRSRQSSTGSTSISTTTGVASAEEVLSLYYARMIALFGEPNLKWTEIIPDSDVKFLLQESPVPVPSTSETGNYKRRAGGVVSDTRVGKRR